MKDRTTAKIHRLELRLSEQEMNKLRASANLEAISVSEFVRRSITGATELKEMAKPTVTTKIRPSLKPDEPWDGISDPVLRATAEYDARVSAQR